MAEIVTIRPRSGSKMFKAVKGQITQFQKITEGGQDTDRSAGEYKSERFPNSRQMFRPMWSNSKRRWLIKNFDSNSEDLNKLVTSCKLKYEKNSHKPNQYIMEADLYDANDPFFNHKSLKVITYEGQITLDKNRPIDKIILLSLQANHQFQEGGESINPLLSSRVRYVITDKNLDTSIKKKTRQTSLDALKLYDKLSDDKKVKIAMAMGLISNESVDRVLIDEVLWEACQDNVTKASNKESKQDIFIKMCNSDSTELNMKHLIQKAKASGKLKKNKTQGYLLFGQPIGTTESKIFEYFSNPENQEMLIRLEQSLEND